MLLYSSYAYSRHFYKVKYTCTPPLQHLCTIAIYTPAAIHKSQLDEKAKITSGEE